MRWFQLFFSQFFSASWFQVKDINFFSHKFNWKLASTLNAKLLFAKLSDSFQTTILANNHPTWYPLSPPIPPPPIMVWINKIQKRLLCVRWLEEGYPISKKGREECILFEECIQFLATLLLYCLGRGEWSIMYQKLDCIQHFTSNVWEGTWLKMCVARLLCDYIGLLVNTVNDARYRK